MNQVGKKLESIVEEWMFEKGMDTRHEKWRYMQLAWRGFNELHLDVVGSPKSLLERVDEQYLSIPIPGDMISNHPEIWMPRGDRMIPVPHKYDKNRAVQDCNGNNTYASDPQIQINDLSASYVTPDYIAEHYRNHEYVGRNFGMEGGSVFTHFVNWSTGYIEFSSEVTGYVVIDYLAEAPKRAKDVIVHPALWETMFAWMNWVTVRSKPSVPLQVKTDAKREYFRAKDWAKIRFNQPNENDKKEAGRRGLTQAARF